MQREIVIRERSSLEVDAATYDFLLSSADFRALAAAGIVELRQLAGHKRLLRAHGYVGHAIVEGRPIIVKEKIEGALAGLLSVSGDIGGRPVDAPAGVDAQSRLIQFFVERFADLARQYASAGRERSYVRSEEASSIARGRILIPPTIREIARGRRDRVVVARDILTGDTQVNRLIALGLRAADRILSASGRSSLLYSIRALSMLFEDADVSRLANASFPVLDGEFTRALSSGLPADRRAVLQMSRVLVMHFGLYANGGERAPMTWFVNLETMFEDATRMALAKSAPEYDLSVSDWRISRSYVLDRNRYRAEPDVVIRRAKRAIAIADMKYKNLEASPETSDIYQLLAHAEAFEVAIAALVYPNSRHGLRELGRSPSNRKVIIAELRPTDLISDAGHLLASLA